jgi:hypothetical protein
MTILEQVYALREAMDIAGATLTEEKALECVRLYREWEVGKKYKGGERFTYGFNNVGDPQLYVVNDGKEHTSQADWTADKEKSLYRVIGLDDEGYTVWSQPTGSHDAYNEGDIVNYNGTLYKSKINGNVYSPDAYPDGWEVFK